MPSDVEEWKDELYGTDIRPEIERFGGGMGVDSRRRCLLSPFVSVGRGASPRVVTPRSCVGNQFLPLRFVLANTKSIRSFG